MTVHTGSLNLSSLAYTRMSKAALTKAATEGAITHAQADEIWQQYKAHHGEHPLFSASNAAYCVGAVAFVWAMRWSMSLAWGLLGRWGFFGVSGFCALCLSLAVNALRKHKPRKTPAALRYRLKDYLESRDVLPKWAITLCISDPQEGYLTISSAIIHNNMPLLEQLLDAGIDPKAYSRFGSNHMYGAAACENKQAIQMLLDRGVDIEQATTTGDRPIFAALGSETDEFDQTGIFDPNIELCSDFMIKKGANMDRCGDEIESPKDAARKMGHPRYI